MRKPKDFDAELVVAAGADALPIETLAGALLAAAEAKDSKTQEGWRARGATFFRSSRRNATGAPPDRTVGTSETGGTLPFAEPPSA